MVAYEIHFAPFAYAMNFGLLPPKMEINITGRCVSCPYGRLPAFASVAAGARFALGQLCAVRVVRVMPYRECEPIQHLLLVLRRPTVAGAACCA